MNSRSSVHPPSRRSWLAMLLVAAALSAPPFSACGQPLRQLEKVDWVRRPTGDDLANAYPEQALRQGVPGLATMRCIIGAKGKLTGCQILTEVPKNFGFGAAVLKLADSFLAPIKGPDGLPTQGAQVTIPMTMTTGDKALVVEHPGWLAAPSVVDIAAALGPSSFGAAEAVTAVIDCGVLAKGKLGLCAAAARTKVDARFTRAAISLAPKFQLSPMADGKWPVRSIVRLSVRFAPQIEPPVAPRPYRWLEAPEATEAAASFPAALRATGVLKGAARVTCTVGDDGFLTRCSSAGETAAGVGEAARALAAKFRMSVWTEAGTSVAGAPVTLPLAFDISDARPGG